jgi:hypothetical protein
MSALAILVPSRLARLIAADARNVSRDPMLVMGSLMSLLPALALWLGRSALDEAAFDAFGVTGFSQYAVPVALLLPAVMVGWVSGFLFLEDRDEGPLVAIEVTPIGKLGFMVYRLAATALITAAITVLAVQLLLPGSALWLKMLIVLAIPANAVLSALVLPAAARNKVEGLAVTKLMNLAAVAPLLAILPTPFRLVGGIVPSYWLGEWLNLGGEPILPMSVSVLIGSLVHIAALVIVVRINRRAG